MPQIWRKVFSRTTTDSYDFSRLVDRIKREPNTTRQPGNHIICDIDKTYLETEFESFFHMARVAFESASAKITVRGASDVLLAARWGDQSDSDSPAEIFPRGLHFVSSSPPQLRPVLEQKLSLDGLDWSSDTFKNQAYNVLKRRMDQLRQHVGYKSAAILQVIRSQGDHQSYYMIGDNAESDAFIYTGASLRLAGKLNVEQYAKYLTLAGIDEFVAEEISTNFDKLPNSHVAGIFIRNAPGYKFIDAPTLTGGIKTFDHFFQLALLLIQRDLIPISLLPSMTRAFHNQYAFSREDLAAELLALLRDTQSTQNQQAIKDILAVLKFSDAVPSLMNYGETEASLDLTASEILDHAREWMVKMHAYKTTRL